MKKLTELRLKEFHEMNDSEMKSIRGGYGRSQVLVIFVLVLLPKILN